VRQHWHPARRCLFARQVTMKAARAEAEDGWFVGGEEQAVGAAAMLVGDDHRLPKRHGGVERILDVTGFQQRQVAGNETDEICAPGDEVAGKAVSAMPGCAIEAGHRWRLSD